MSAADIITLVLTAGGLFFYIAGTVGLLRFPDVFSRLHALTKADNLGLGMIAVGLVPQMPSLYQALPLLFIWLLVMAASATCSHLVARHAMGGRRATNGGKGHAG